MEEIYSEKELFQNKDLKWGQWNFSMSNEEIDQKIASLPKSKGENKNHEHWPKLFSVLQEHQNISDFELSNKSHDFVVSPDIATECSLDLEIEDIEKLEGSAEESNSIEELTICLVDLCNQLAPRLKQSLDVVKSEMKSFVEDISKLKDDSLTSVMVDAWSQISSDASKFCFCIPFTSNTHLCRKLCEVIVKPWLSKNPPSKIEQLSIVLSAEGETVCKSLLSPLLQTEDSLLNKDILILEDLMAHMVEKHWTVLLRELLKDLRELQSWQIPSLAIIVEHAKPSSDEVHLLTQLMSSSGTSFAQSRDFGALLVAVAKSLHDSDMNLVTQLKLIVNNYKGPLKFKALKILDDIES